MSDLGSNRYHQQRRGCKGVLGRNENVIFPMINQVSQPRWRDYYYYWSQSVLILDLVGEDKRGTGSVVAGTRLCGNEESVKRDQRPVSPIDKNFQLWARLLTIVQSLGVNGNSERGLDTGAESLGVGETDDTGVVTGVGTVHARSAFRSRG